jgi:23S rRNA-/tRNA-specific pseudouridylate synthase
LRRLAPTDSMEELTTFLHEAYAGLAAQGMHYFASRQTPADTARRARSGECWVAHIDGRLAGTVTFYPQDRAGGCPLYDEPDVASFGQLGVRPDLRGRGLGATLLDLVETRARAGGAAWIACDTAMPARHLVRIYESRGYLRAAQTQWDKVNYRSHLLVKPLRETPRVVSDDRGVLALFKPSGMPVYGEHSLLAWAANHLGTRDLAAVHRLDAGTSGVVLTSEDADIRAELGRHFESGEIKKVYLTLVHGRPHKKGKVSRALKDARRRSSVKALTRYRTVERHPKTAVLRVRPETGRKHQIRRHLAGIGLPVVGDKRYGDSSLRVPAFPGRLWLHAESLVLPDGRRFYAPLAWELAAHLAALRR